MKTLLRAVGVLVLALGAGVSYAVPANAIDTDPSRNGCKEYVFLGIRGSSQDYNDQWNGVGKQVWNTFYRFDLFSLASERVDLLGIRYPAVKGELAIQDSDKYLSSVREGIVEVTDKVRHIVDDCGVGTKIVIAGYSQGGQVAHQVPKALTLYDDKYSNRVKGILTIGDPTRVDDQPGTRDFTAEDVYNIEEDRGDKGAGILARRYGIGDCDLWAPCIPGSFRTPEGKEKVTSVGFDADRIVNAGSTTIGTLIDALQVGNGAHDRYGEASPASYQAGKLWGMATRD